MFNIDFSRYLKFKMGSQTSIQPSLLPSTPDPLSSSACAVCSPSSTPSSSLRMHSNRIHLPLPLPLRNCLCLRCTYTILCTLLLSDRTACFLPFVVVVLVPRFYLVGCHIIGNVFPLSLATITRTAAAHAVLLPPSCNQLQISPARSCVTNYNTSLSRRV